VRIVESGGNLLEEIPLVVEVLPFDLPEPKIEYSLYYRGKLAPDQATISSEYKSEIQMRAELHNIREHGVKNPTIYQRYRPKKGERRGSKTESEAHLLFKRYLQIRKELSMTDSNFYYLGRLIGLPQSKPSFDLLNSDIQNLQNIIRPFGFKALYLYGRDEAKGQRLLEQRTAWKFIREKGAKVFVAGSVGHFEAVGELTDLLVYHGPPNRKEANKFHSVRNLIYSYANPPVGPENPFLFRLNYGIKLWQSGFDGVMNYSYQHSAGSIWNDFDHKIYRDIVFAYPTVNGVIDTLAWEGFREAVDDVRYITALENLLKQQTFDDDIAKERATISQSYLDSLQTNAHPDPGQIRSDIINHILRITSSTK
jgi:hypothetical protein